MAHHDAANVPVEAVAVGLQQRAEGLVAVLSLLEACYEILLVGHCVCFVLLSVTLMHKDTKSKISGINFFSRELYINLQS